jgi:membrane protein YqaA with SNARE-associated domain
MKVFSYLYQRVMAWSTLPRAPWYLSGLSFAESSFFPIPPDVMLAPMSLARPEKAWNFALLTTVASVLGGLMGYAIGLFAIDAILPHLQNSHYWHAFTTAQLWFKQFGFLAIFIAGFTPVPYKVFTIAAGTLAMPIIPFVLGSLIGRGMRFYLVAGLMKFGGVKMETKLRQTIDTIGWVTLFFLISIALIIKLS